jgi:hypothetical protein
MGTICSKPTAKPLLQRKASRAERLEMANADKYKKLGRTPSEEEEEDRLNK